MSPSKKFKGNNRSPEIKKRTLNLPNGIRGSLYLSSYLKTYTRCPKNIDTSGVPTHDDLGFDIKGHLQDHL